MIKIFDDDKILAKTLALEILLELKKKKRLVLGCPGGRSLKKTYKRPVYVAAVGPRMIEVAVELGDGLVFCWPTIEFLRTTIPMVKALLEGQGRDPGKFKFVVQTGFEVTNNKDLVLEAMKTKMSFIYQFKGIARVFRSSGHNVEEISRKLRENYGAVMNARVSESSRELDGLTRSEIIRKIIPGDLVEEVGFIGTIDELKKKLDLYQELGVTDMFVPAPEIDHRNQDYQTFVNQLIGKI